MEPFERLRRARERAKYATAADAARAFGWTEVTYRSHENGTRGLTRTSARRYAKAFRVSPEWLLFGRGEENAAQQLTVAKRSVPIVGYVGAGAQAHFLPAGHLGEIIPPFDNVDDRTVAVEIRGDSLGPFFEHWIVFYDDIRRPVTDDLAGRLCVVGLADGRIMVKKLKPSKARGFYHLLSQTEDPILDVALEWAAPVRAIMPR